MTTLKKILVIAAVCCAVAGHYGVMYGKGSSSWPSTKEWFEAVNTGNVEQVRALINAKVDRHATDKEGRSALMLAAFNGNTDMVKELLEAGPLINAKDKVGSTALMYAVSGIYQAYRNNWVTHMAIVDVDEVEGLRKTYFRKASGDAATLLRVTACINVIKALLEAPNINVNAKNNNGNTALDIASSCTEECYNNNDRNEINSIVNRLKSLAPKERPKLPIVDHSIALRARLLEGQ